MDRDKIYKIIKPYTMCSKERTFATINAVKHVVEYKLLGNVVECGVYKGGQVMAMLLVLDNCTEERDVYLYDTFEGLPEPEPWEKKILSKTGSKAIDKFNLLKRQDGTSGWCRSEIEEVKRNVFSMPYDRSKIHFIKGLVEDTLPNSYHGEISVLRLDTDLYSSTKIELEILYPKLVSGGVLIVDDYGHWSGAKKAVDEYISNNNLDLEFIVDDATGRTIIKP